MKNMDKYTSVFMKDLDIEAAENMRLIDSRDAPGL
jgi:hypothetical protein